jgi:hypothetical protein
MGFLSGDTMSSAATNGLLSPARRSGGRNDLGNGPVCCRWSYYRKDVNTHRKSVLWMSDGRRTCSICRPCSNISRTAWSVNDSSTLVYGDVVMCSAMRNGNTGSIVVVDDGRD